MPEAMSDQEIIYNYLKGLELEVNNRFDKQDDAIIELGRKQVQKQFFGTPSTNGNGDMKKSRYDTNDDGIVDEAATITNQGALATLNEVTETELSTSVNASLELADSSLQIEVKSSSFTAELDRIYHVVATSTVTDPTPEEGKGFTVLVRNGTATIGGTTYSTAGTIIKRTFHSGSYTNYIYQEGEKEPTITEGTTSQYWRGDKSRQTLNKSAVGLSNVDNTSDATKNSATATLTNKDLTSGTNTFPIFNQNTTGTASNVTGTVAVANGGTGATTASGARTALDVPGLTTANTLTGIQTQRGSLVMQKTTDDGSAQITYKDAASQRQVFYRRSQGVEQPGVIAYAYDETDYKVLYHLLDSGDVIFGNNVTISSSLTVNGQNRASGWTSWTPTIGATGGGSASGVSVVNAIYKKIGRIMFISGRLSFSKNTLSGSVYMSLPEVDSAFICSINAWIGEQGSTGATLNGGRTQMEATGSVYFENGFGTSYIQASDLTAGTQQVRFNGFYQTAS